jgi:hypothetical protein
MRMKLNRRDSSLSALVQTFCIENQTGQIKFAELIERSEPRGGGAYVSVELVILVDNCLIRWL